MAFTADLIGGINAKGEILMVRCIDLAAKFRLALAVERMEKILDGKKK